MYKKFGLIYQPKTQRSLYILLLIFTPFLLLQNYLQSAIAMLSNFTFKVFGIDFVLSLSVLVLILVIVFIFSYKKLTVRRIISWFIIVFLFWIGQKTTDFYFNHKFYELQYNWHYFAYAIFAFLNYRLLRERNTNPSKIILKTFFSAIVISTFDELIQIPLSNRIFDLGDISKDLWGTMIGLFFIYFILENGKNLNKGLKIKKKQLKDYLNSPNSLLFFGFVLAYIFMTIASILTETDYIFTAVFFSLLLFTLFFVVIHTSQFKFYRVTFIILFSIFTLAQSYSFIKNFNKGVVYNSNNILVYKGVPIFYFDVLVYPNGLFRLVDKKKVFNQRDQQTILDLAGNIIVIGSGNDGSGGKGFPEDLSNQFVFVNEKRKGVQIIILPNKQAIKNFNILYLKKKKPLLIYHNN